MCFDCASQPTWSISMPTLLHIESSPRKTRSASLDVARAYLGAYRHAHPDHLIEVLDLWSTELPEFDGDALDAKYADLSGTLLSEGQQRAWADIRRLAQRLHDADTLLFSVPLWNFSIPYKLKHFIDVVSQRNVLFSFDERGLRGLLKDKKAVVIYARGLDYSMDSNTPAHSFDFQRPFMDAWLRSVGVINVESVVVEKTLFGPEFDQSAREAARERAVALVGTASVSVSGRILQGD
jgi:FMN-dependent NADH-azoreductase